MSTETAAAGGGKGVGTTEVVAPGDFDEKIQMLGDQIAGLTLLEARDLGSYLEQKYGIAPAAGGPPPGDQKRDTGPVVEEKTEWDVILASFGSQKMEVIKAIRQITSLGLKESKELVEGAPKEVRTGISKDEAEKIKTQLEAAGAKVELK